MTKLKKIIQTVILFICLLFMICFLFSLYKVLVHEIAPTDILQETGLYFLYTIGYGALEGDSVIQNVLAMIGIISLALMTTFLTINLFWRLDDVKLKKEIQYHGDCLKMQFKNKGGAICDMKATFVLYDEQTSENIGEPKEYYMPMLVKNSVWNLSFDLDDTFWYRAVYELLSCPTKKLYCVFSFVDTKTGQSSIKVEEITKEQLRCDHGILEYEEFIKPVILSSKELISIENNGILQRLEEKNGTRIKFTFSKNVDESSFVMLYYNFHGHYLNLEKYNRENTYLEVALTTDEPLHLTFEIKLSNDNTIKKHIDLNHETKLVQIALQEVSGSIEEIKEICYTIFKKNNSLTGSVQIGDLRIITK